MRDSDRPDTTTERAFPFRALGLAWIGTMIVPTLALAWGRLSALAPRSLVLFAGGIAGSVASFLVVSSGVAALARRRPRAGRTLGALLAGSMGFVCAFAWAYRIRYGADVPVSFAGFAIENRAYAWNIVKEETGPALRVLLVCAPLLSASLAAWVLARWARTVHAPPTRTTTVLTGVAIAGLAVDLSVPTIPVAPDGLAARAVVAAVEIVLDDAHLPTPRRLEVPAVATLPRERRPNVVLVVGETVSADEWAAWNASAEAGKDLAAFVEAHGDAFVLFERTSSGGSATDISVPSMLTGLATTASVSDYERAPILWQEAKARGYRTGLFSPQRYDWLHFDEFFLRDHRPDVVRTSADYGGPVVNDGGPADDRVVADALAFATEDRSSPFFLVLQFNATHFPYWAPNLPPLAKFVELVQNDRVHRRPESLRYVSELLTSVFTTLEAKGLLDDTLVMMTADHGAGRTVLRLPRIESNHEDVLRVPLGIHLPSAFRKTRPDAVATMRANAGRRTSNGDLFPTLLDLWGTPVPLPEGRPPFAGRSLFADVPADRALFVMSTGPVRTWKRHSFAVYRGPRKWIVDEFDGVHFHDLARDPDERVGAVPTAADQDFLVREASRVPPARRLLERLAPPWLP